MGRFLRVALFAVLTITALLGMAGFEVWRRAGNLIAEDEHWATEAARRLRDKEKERERLQWPGYQEFLGRLAAGRVASTVRGIDEGDLAILGKWHSSGFPFEEMEPSDDPGFDNRHAPFGGSWRPTSLRQLQVETIAVLDLTQGGSLCVGFLRTAWELRVLMAWQTLLATTSLSASKLEECAALLDRMEAARPSLKDQIEGERCLRVRTVLDLYRTGKGPKELVRGKPDWRSLFSRRIFFARILNELARKFAEEVAAESLPEADRIEIGREHRRKDPTECHFGFVHGSMVWSLYWYEAYRTLNRRLLRTSIAAAWFEAETGALPKTLAELVPRYLPSLKDCPITGQPLHYADRSLWSKEQCPANRWVLCRR